MDHRPAAVEAAREEGRVLVLGRHDRSEATDLRKSRVVASADERPAAAVGRVGDRPFLALGQPGDARVLAAPGLLGIAIDVGLEERLGIEPPVGDAVGAAGDVELGDPAEVLDADEEDRLVPDSGGAGIEDRVRGIRDVGRRQDGVRGVAPEERLGLRHRVDIASSCAAGRRLAARASRKARMCSAAISHISVDSAPWFVLTPVGVRPSQPAPRAGSAT